jgi:hypothetical protein
VIEFPENTALILEVGCTSCDAPARGVRRIYRNRGTVHVDDLFVRPEEVRNSGNVYITSMAVSTDGSTVVVAVCVRSYCGGLGFPESDAAAVFHVSRDGGVTWIQESQARALRIFSITERGWATGRWETDDAIVVGPDSFARPSEASEVFWGTNAAGQVFWSAKNRLFLLDGSELVSVSQAERIISVILEPGSTPISGWFAPNNVPGYYFTRQDASGEQVGIRLADFVLAAVYLDPGRFIIDIDAGISAPGRVPAIVDVNARSVRPIGDIPDVLSGGRNRPIAVYHGPFLRVEGEGGGCLTLHETADETSPLIDCLASKVLVRDLLRGTGTATRQWHEVETLDGRRGWAELQHLKSD